MSFTLTFNQLLVLASIAGLFLLYLWGIYNSFVITRNKVKTDFADIDVQLKRRAGLIENLVEIVKGYAKHEEETFENVAKARSAVQSAPSPKQAAQADNMLSSTLRSILAISEAYPKLQASENFQRLQQDLKETEDIIAQYRETYNQTVMKYNTKLQVFPNLLFTGMFGFQQEELFQPGEISEVEIKMT